MTEAELLELLRTNRGRDVLNRLAQVPPAERRQHAKAVVRLYTDVEAARFSSKPKPRIRDEEAVTVGLLATATLSDLKKAGYLAWPGTVALADVIAALRPDWTQGFVDHIARTHPNLIDRLAPVWRAGLCQRPEGDAIILGYYAQFRGDGEDETDLLTRDVWRFFEVEGGGEFSLANHDKLAKPGADTWESRLIAYARAGKLDRHRLLDASLDALERDFGQYRAGWYSRFHVSLAPTPAEVTARATRYLGLLGSSVPPTVSFAIKFVQTLDKADALEPAAMLGALEPALQARAKGTVAAALKLVARAAKRDPALRPRAASHALLALVCEDAGIQDKALDLFQSLDGPANDQARAALGAYVDLLAPSVRPRTAVLAGTAPAAAGAPSPQADTPPTPAAMAPVADGQDALALFLSVLENPRDPFAVERAVDGLSRFGAELRADPAVLSPLRKRAAQIWANPGAAGIRAVLALTGRALAESTPIAQLWQPDGDDDRARALPAGTLQHAHLRRNAELADRVLDGTGLPMLSLPSDSSGTVSVADLHARLANYRAAGVTPGPVDMSLALMRLAPDRRGGPAPGDGDGDDEAARALAYALGADGPVGPTAELWAAAWRARRPLTEDMRITALFDPALPDCGLPIGHELNVRRKESACGAYFWITVDVPATPAIPNRADILPAIYAFHPDPSLPVSSSCGTHFADIAWASLAMPVDPEPFFRQGMLQQDTWQNLTDNPTRAFLEPFFRPGGGIGDLGAGLLAYYMACEDKSVTALAADAAAQALSQRRLSEVRFAAALAPFLMSGALPTRRWTKALAAMAEAGAQRHVCAIIAQLLDFPPEETPRDLGGMLELLYELHVAAGTAPERPETLACLETLPGGGKVAKFSKKLRAMASEAA
ncbi:MAG: DUF6493 family protein [Pseudomonadota bacterium]